MCACSAFVLVFRIFGEANLHKHIDAVDLGTSIQEREIKEIAIEGGHDGRLHLLNMREETFDCGSLHVISFLY